MIGKVWHKFLSLFKSNKKETKKYIRVKIERLVFDPDSERYLLLLKKDGEENGRSIILEFDWAVVEEELFLASSYSTRQVNLWLNQLGVEILLLRINKRDNSPDSAMCLIKQGKVKKQVSISAVEAVFLALEQSYKLELAEEITSVGRFGVNKLNEEKMVELRDPFHPEFGGKDYFNDGAIM